MSTTQKTYKTAIVTGANRGLGYGCVKELLRQNFAIIATARDLPHLQELAQKEDWPAQRTHLFELDVSNEESLGVFEKKLEPFEQIDVLINNAGVYLDPRDEKILGVSGENLMQTLRTNVYGPFRMCQIVLPHMLKTKTGRIVNVSSGMGQMSEMQGGYESYRLSKAALNALTATLASDLRGTKILVNSVCPGWVRTDMGGPNASREIAEGVRSILWAALLPENSTVTGGFYRDGESLAW